MRLRLPEAVCLAAMLLTGTVAGAEVTTTSLGQAAADTATRACVGILSQDVAFPEAVDDQQKLLASYGLSAGLPQAALDETGQFRALFNRATLAHRAVASDAFAFALGGAQPTCRLVLYRIADRASTKAVLATALASPAMGWKEAPTQQASAAAERRMFIKRSAGGKPMLLNMISGIGAAESQPIIVTVVALPAGIQLPKGF